MEMTRNERNELAAAFSDFDAVYDLLVVADKLLDDADDADKITVEWRSHKSRIGQVQKSVSGVKKAISHAGDIYASARPALGSLDNFMPVVAAKVIRGGTMALSAITYDTRRYLKQLNGEAIGPHGFAQMMEWGALGMIAELIGDKRHGA